MHVLSKPLPPELIDHTFAHIRDDVAPLARVLPGLQVLALLSPSAPRCVSRYWVLLTLPDPYRTCAVLHDCEEDYPGSPHYTSLRHRVFAFYTNLAHFSSIKELVFYGCSFSGIPELLAVLCTFSQLTRLTLHSVTCPRLLGQVREKKERSIGFCEDRRAAVHLSYLCIENITTALLSHICEWLLQTPLAASL
ncbi:hypothetical protein BKA93DRAFT_216460 [Sparassis latifolia]